MSTAGLDPSSFAHVASRGSASSPRPYTQPTFERGERLDKVRIWNEEDNTIRFYPNVLVRVPGPPNARPLSDGFVTQQQQYPPSPDEKPQRGYYIYKKLKGAIYGKVTLAIIIVPVPPSQCRGDVRDYCDEADSETVGAGAGPLWKFTSTLVAIKQINWVRLQQLSQRRHAEDPIKELAAMQYVNGGGGGQLGGVGEEDVVCRHVTRLIETLR